jgi:hypothetical protein
VVAFRFRRLLAIVGGALAIGIFATGCSATSSAAPTAGQCWRVTYSAAVQSEAWAGSAAVPCASKHESYTYAVTKLARTFTGSWVNSNGTPRTDVNAAAFAACQARQKAVLPGLTPKEALLYPTYYVPSVAQWNGGARWVRCDVTEIKVGSEVAKPALTPLPAQFADLVGTLSKTPEKFALCENDVFNNGPDGDQTTYADCTGPADWTFQVRLTLPDGASTPYPGSAALTALGAQKCAAAVPAKAGHDIVAKTPSETEWVKNGSRSIDCWLNNN